MFHITSAVGLILQLSSPIGNRTFRKKTKQNFTTEGTPHSVFFDSHSYFTQVVLPTIQVSNSVGEKPVAPTDALQAAVESAEVDKMDTTNIMFSSTSTHSQRQQIAGYNNFE